MPIGPLSAVLAFGSGSPAGMILALVGGGG